MTKYFVELNEILTYNLIVEAEDADDAWDVALKTRKFVQSDNDDMDTECKDITEVPEDLLDCTEPDELHEGAEPRREYAIVVVENPTFPYIVEKDGWETVAHFGYYDDAVSFILSKGVVIDGDGETS